MAQIVSLTASTRQSTGKGAARQARFRGEIPAVIYGRGRDTQPLAVEAKALEKALKIGDSLHVRQLQIPNVTILTHGDLTIATVVPPRAEEVTAPTPEAVAEVAEPELIRKVREGEEEAEGEAAEGGPKPEAKGAAAPAKGAAPPAKGEKGEKPEKTEKPKGGKES